MRGKEKESMNKKTFMRIGLSDSEGSPGPVPAGRRAGPTKGGWLGLEKRRARRAASAKLFSNAFPSLQFLLPLQPSRVAVRLRARRLYSVASVGRPYPGSVRGDPWASDPCRYTSGPGSGFPNCYNWNFRAGPWTRTHNFFSLKAKWVGGLRNKQNVGRLR